jgi:FkbM family methyltransferase
MLSTIFSLLRESAQYSKGGTRSFLPTFLLLLNLYVKSWRARKNKVRVAKRIGQFTFYAFDYPTLINLYREIFLKEVYRTDLGSSEPFIIDCGSNVGISVLYFKSKYPDSEIWAFEPSPDSFELLKKNVEENRISNVKLFNCAVGNTKGVIQFYQPSEGAYINGSFYDNHAAAKTIPVEVVRLSDLISKVRVDLMKIDIEGSEGLVVSDLEEKQLLQPVGEYVIEFHPRVGSMTQTLESFIGYFERVGFRHSIRSIDEAGNVVIHFSSGI